MRDVFEQFTLKQLFWMGATAVAALPVLWIFLVLFLPSKY